MSTWESKEQFDELVDALRATKGIARVTVSVPFDDAARVEAEYQDCTRLLDNKMAKALEDYEWIMRKEDRRVFLRIYGRRH